MNFCVECGHKLNENLTFCTACGAKQPGDQTASVPVQAAPIQRSEKHVPKKPISKRNKILIGTAGSLALVLFAAHLILSSYFDPMKDLQAMDQAISVHDVDTFMSYIDFDTSAPLHEEEYFQYIKDVEWETIKAQFLAMLEDDHEGNILLNRVIYNSYGEKLFDVQIDSFLKLYPTYSFHALPARLIVSANIEQTEMQLDDLSFALETTDSEEVLEIYPGSYTVQASAKNIFGAFNYEEELEIRYEDYQQFYVEFSGSTYSFYTNEEDATLFVNGEDTGVTFSELDVLGPFPDEAGIEMHGEWENAAGDKMITDVITLDNVGWYGIEFVFTEDQTAKNAPAAENIFDEENKLELNDIEGIVLDFRDAYETALNTRNFSLIQPYLEEGSSAYNDLDEFIGDLEDTAYHYDFTVNDILDSVEDGEHVIVTTNELFTFTNHLDDQIDYDRTKDYTVVQSDDTYKITDIDYVETNRDY